MRITWGMMLNNMLAGMNGSARTMVKFQNQLATGKRVNKPSDDPRSVVRILSLRSTLGMANTHLSNIAQGKEWLTVTEMGLDRAAGIVARAKELATQGANDTLAQHARDAIAAEVSEMIEALLAAANTKHVDRYVFAGTDNRDQPFDLVGTPPTGHSFTGNTGVVSWQIEPGVVHQVNVAGDPLFTPAFDALISLRDNLLANNPAAISGTDIQQLADAHNVLLTGQTDVGAKYNRLEESHGSLTLLRQTVFEQLNIYESVDMAEAIMRLQMAQSSYYAAQAATARVIRPTLVDLLQ